MRIYQFSALAATHSSFARARSSSSSQTPCWRSAPSSSSAKMYQKEARVRVFGQVHPDHQHIALPGVLPQHLGHQGTLSDAVGAHDGQPVNRGELPNIHSPSRSSSLRRPKKESPDTWGPARKRFVFLISTPLLSPSSQRSSSLTSMR